MTVEVVRGQNYLASFINRPSKLNVLDEEVVKLLTESLAQAKTQELIISANGVKGFCAGGDVVSVVQGIKEGRPWDFFFKQEYELDLSLHKRTEKVTCFAHGIVMGGGMGVMKASHEAIVCEKTIFSMPEVTIGFFPDVGASYFLGQLPRKWQKFIALTGAFLPAQWAKRLSLVDRVIEEGSYWKAYDLLKSASGDWRDALIDSEIKGDSEWQEVDRVLNQLDECHDLESFDQWACEEHGSWIDKSLQKYRNGSFASKVITWNMLTWMEGRTLDECFERDLFYAKLCCEQGDFYEGVRALLIDKDKNPKWRDHDLMSAIERLRAFF